MAQACGGALSLSFPVPGISVDFAVPIPEAPSQAAAAGQGELGEQAAAPPRNERSGFPALDGGVWGAAHCGNGS